MLSFLQRKITLYLTVERQNVLNLEVILLEMKNIIIYSHFLLLMDKVRHIVNIIEEDCNEITDCGFKYYV